MQVAGNPPAVQQVLQQPVLFYIQQPGQGFADLSTLNTLSTNNTTQMMMAPIMMPQQQWLAQQQQQLMLAQRLAQQQQVQMLPLVPTATSSTLNSNSSCADKEEVESNMTHDSVDSGSIKLSNIPLLSSGKASPEPSKPAVAVPPLKSTSTTPVSGLAGAIAKRVREHGTADIVALGVEGSNQAVKAMALARTFIVQEGMTLLVSPTYPEEDEESDGNVKFHAEGIPNLSADDTCDTATPLDVNIRVSANSHVRKTAGAIAKLMRGPGQQGRTIGILTMGAESVHVTVQAVTSARAMLEQDSLDVIFKPRFIHVDDEVSNQPKPALRLSLFLTHRK
eukprot:TRINITY_DN734_c0_g1_i1.p1 TRINITY_DN734_c0_g1~~TRINITY_DN734_c0_g1_i1.p1  ORF type:complete len:336 (+),score=59.63 TRINITY_DN734_c0_g1_i1:200-1207(+)